MPPFQLLWTEEEHFNTMKHKTDSINPQGISQPWVLIPKNDVNVFVIFAGFENSARVHSILILC
jgi:hypothetical protein